VVELVVDVWARSGRPASVSAVRRRAFIKSRYALLPPWQSPSAAGFWIDVIFRSDDLRVVSLIPSKKPIHRTTHSDVILGLARDEF
jgi:hypothetical protein